MVRLRAINSVQTPSKYSYLSPCALLSTAAAADGKAILRVRDHGPGIAPGQRRRIFRAFRKSAEQAAGTAPGVGLGLSLSRRLARSMRGELRCEAPAGGGACFALSLPTEK